MDGGGITAQRVKRGLEHKHIRSYSACGSLVHGCGLRLISDELFLCSDFDLPRRAAGSEEDERLAALIFDEFKVQGMAPWTDDHYVQLQTPNRFDAPR